MHVFTADQTLHQSPAWLLNNIITPSYRECDGKPADDIQVNACPCGLHVQMFSDTLCWWT